MGFLELAMPALVAAAAVSVAQGASTQSRDLLQVTESGCKISVNTSVNSQSARLAAEAASEATAIICGQDTASEVEVEAVAEATARAAATAVANVAAVCYASGQGSFKVNGLTRARSEARAYAEAFAEGTATASVCNKCEAAASFVAESWDSIFFEAVAEAEVELAGAANGGSVEGVTEIFVEAVAEATVTAYASVLAIASASVDDDCNVQLLADVITGPIDNPNSASCDIRASGEDETIAEDAVATAVFEAKAFACEGKAEAQGQVTAEALATAAATAISSVVLDCFVEGSGYACAAGEARIKSSAAATARAFARGFTEAISTCDEPKCTISIEAVVENTEDVLVNAASDAYASACAGPDDFFGVDDIEEDIKKATINAFAKVIASAVVDGDDCSIGLDLVATNTVATNTPSGKCAGKCAANNKKCGGKGFAEVKGCCSDNYKCVKKNNSYMQCRRNGKPPRNSNRWDGAVIPCSKA